MRRFVLLGTLLLPLPFAVLPLLAVLSSGPLDGGAGDRVQTDSALPLSDGAATSASLANQDVALTPCDSPAGLT